MATRPLWRITCCLANHGIFLQCVVHLTRVATFSFDFVEDHAKPIHAIATDPFIEKREMERIMPNKKKFNNTLIKQLKALVRQDKATEALRLLANKGIITAVNSNADTVLVSMIKQGAYHFNFARLWIANGGEVFAMNKQGISALMLLLEQGDESLIVYAMVRYKHYKDQCNLLPLTQMCTKKGKGLLAFAAQSGSPNKLSQLLRAGCKIIDHTPLDIALRKKNILMIRVLLPAYSFPIGAEHLSQVVWLYLKEKSVLSEWIATW